jgi:hypothetical protein
LFERPSTRRQIIEKSITEFLRSTRPLGHLVAAMGAGSGLLGTVVGMLFGSKVHSGLGKALLTGATMAAPMVTERIRTDERSGRVLHELGRSWERMKAHVAERMAAHRAGQE